jgi:hypothetical protein
LGLNGGEESGIRFAPFRKTLCCQRHASKRSLYRHFPCITSVTSVTKKSSVDHRDTVYGMDGMDRGLLRSQHSVDGALITTKTIFDASDAGGACATQVIEKTRY